MESNIHNTSNHPGMPNNPNDQNRSNPNSPNKKMLWFSIAGLALLGAVTVYALTNGDESQDRAEGPTSTTGTRSAGGGNNTGGGSSSITLPAGTAIALTLQTSLSTKTAAVGDRFTARVSSPVRVSGNTVIPAGAEVTGHVVLTEQPGKASGRGKMQLGYDTVRYAGRTYNLDTVSQVYESESGRGKDAAIIGGGAVAGGVAGAVIGGSAKDAGKGAAAGAVAGTAATLLTRGPQLQLDAGTALTVSLDRAVTVRSAPTA